MAFIVEPDRDGNGWLWQIYGKGGRLLASAVVPTTKGAAEHDAERVLLEYGHELEEERSK